MISLESLLESVADAVSSLVTFAAEAGNNNTVLIGLTRGVKGLNSGTSFHVACWIHDSRELLGWPGPSYCGEMERTWISGDGCQGLNDPSICVLTLRWRSNAMVCRPVLRALSRVAPI